MMEYQEVLLMEFSYIYKKVIARNVRIENMMQQINSHHHFKATTLNWKNI